MDFPKYRAGKAQITLYPDPELLAKIDGKRGGESRNKYLNKILENVILS